ncbi:unnamed protein product [Soboliphyme baturini]|uniref:Neur_chan_memb domain-containing protein n=1 Tax=Soboliphyme baturini TaxID=241478 RepID=A0A183IBV6_9BILA|nr:unnamed protein product [Soboliphyme baturini]
MMTDDGGNNEMMSRKVSVDPSIGTSSIHDELIRKYSRIPLFDPARRIHRYSILAIMCFLNFGSYLIYDAPAALNDNIVQVQPDENMVLGRLINADKYTHPPSPPRKSVIVHD